MPEHESFDRHGERRCKSEVRFQSHYREPHTGRCGVRHLLRFESLPEHWEQLFERTG